MVAAAKATATSSAVRDPDRAIGEVKEHLDALDHRYREMPEEHLRALYLLALEREQIVAVSYDETVLGPRIDRLQVDGPTRELVRHALRWIWKEEQMHAMFIRGALLRVGTLVERVVAMAHQLSGALGGWTTSVLHHTHWRDAPLSRMFALFVTTLASWLGKLPRSVKDELRHLCFKDYCDFAVAAEKTAVICWRRIYELASKHQFDAWQAEAFARMSADEDRHSDVFALFRRAFDETDALGEGWNAQRLCEALAGIGDYMLPRRYRPDADDNPLGAGGVVAVHNDAGAPKGERSKAAALRQVLADAGFEQALNAHIARLDKPIEQCVVAIKPTFMLGYNKRDLSTITDPELVRQLCLYLRELGVTHIQLLEGRNLYDWYFEGREVAQVASYFGYDFPEAQLIDTGNDMVEHEYRRAAAHHEVPRSWRDADFRISFGKMRSHPVEQVYLTLGQLEGMTARCEDFVFVDRQAHSGPALMTLLADFPPHFALLDAYENTPDGLLGMLASPAPPSPKRLYAGRDALSVDAVAARHMGLVDLDESQLLETAIDWYGDPQGLITVTGCDRSIHNWRSPCHNEISAVFSFLSFPVYVLLSGRGSLFVPEMDATAFPARGKVSWLLHSARRFLRWLLDMQAPR